MMMRIFATVGHTLVFMVVSSPNRSICTRSIGSDAVMLQSGGLGSFLLNTLHLLQFNMLFIICVLIFGTRTTLATVSRFYLILGVWCHCNGYGFLVRILSYRTLRFDFGSQCALETVLRRIYFLMIFYLIQSS